VSDDLTHAGYGPLLHLLVNVLRLLGQNQSWSLLKQKKVGKSSCSVALKMQTFDSRISTSGIFSDLDLLLEK
jgi:hypothetical protein